ncbi:MAG: hypothetical protein AB7P23_12360 [Amphiplicatus sp.]
MFEYLFDRRAIPRGKARARDKSIEQRTSALLWRVEKNVPPHSFRTDIDVHWDFTDVHNMGVDLRRRSF